MWFHGIVKVVLFFSTSWYIYIYTCTYIYMYVWDINDGVINFHRFITTLVDVFTNLIGCCCWFLLGCWRNLGRIYPLMGCSPDFHGIQKIEKEFALWSSNVAVTKPLSWRFCMGNQTLNRHIWFPDGISVLVGIYQLICLLYIYMYVYMFLYVIQLLYTNRMLRALFIYIHMH